MNRVKQKEFRTVEEMQRPMTLDDLTPHWKLELVLLGAMIANRSLRKEIAETEFCDEELRGAVADIQGKGVGFLELKNALKALGVEWDGTSTPLTALVERQKLNAAYNRALLGLNTLFAGTSKMGDQKAMREVVEAVKRMQKPEGDNAVVVEQEDGN